MRFLETLRQAFRIPDLRKRIFFTLWMFLVFRLGTHVPVPGIEAEVLQGMFQEGTLFGLLDLFSGGALRFFSIFAMSITPYINASIIMQLLTVVIPKFEQLSKMGPEGRKQLQQYIRYGTVILAFIQATGMSFFMRNQGALVRGDFVSMAVIAITLTAGTAFLMWLGEQITEKGIGNGISLLIFAGIVSQLPGGAGRLLAFLQAGTVNIFNIAVVGVLAIVVIAGIVWVQEGQRRIPVRYAKRVVGTKMYGGQQTHIPMKVNQAGVIPVIFASSVLAFPPTLASFIAHPWAQRLASSLEYGQPLYTAIFILFIIFFTYFYTAVTFNPQDVANNIRKYGGFIPGYRPGKPTARYLDRILIRITLVGALFLAAVSVMPIFFGDLVNIPNIFFGGTALLIIVGVALETNKQIEAHLLMRHMPGFLR